MKIYLVDNQAFTNKKIAEKYEVLANLYNASSGRSETVLVEETILDQKSSISMIEEEIRKEIKNWPKEMQEKFLAKNNIE